MDTAHLPHLHHLDAQVATAVSEALAATGPIGIGVLDSDLRYLHVNLTLAAINGKSAEEHLGRTAQEVQPVFASQWVPFARRALAGEATIDVSIESAPPEARRFRASCLPVATGPQRLVATVVVETSGRSHGELTQRDVALTLQRSLLPRSLPRVEGLEFGASYVAATAETEAGGDWYEAVVLPWGSTGLMVGDVVGHGIDAAAVMGQLRSASNAYMLEGLAPAIVLKRLSRYAERVEGAHCATAACVLVDPGRGRARYACAGHPPPLRIPRDGAPSYLEGGRGIVLGVESEAPVNGADTGFHPGDTLLLYSDGAVERRGEGIERGLARLEAAASELRELPPQELCDRLVERLFASQPADDDVVILAARRS